MFEENLIPAECTFVAKIFRALRIDDSLVLLCHGRTGVGAEPSGPLCCCLPARGRHGDDRRPSERACDPPCFCGRRRAARLTEGSPVTQGRRTGTRAPPVIAGREALR